MIVVIALIVGFLTGRMLWIAMQQGWQHPVLMRRNFHGRSLPTAAGVDIALTVLLIEAVRIILSELEIGNNVELTGIRVSMLIAVVGFCFLGLIDDLVGSSAARGMSGHIKALAKGQITTGMIKLLGGGLISIFAIAVLPAPSSSNLLDLLVKAAIVALSANLFNLFDLRPGRCSKFALVVFIGLAIATKNNEALFPAAVVMGAALALMFDDLREKLMIGDTGANPIGAAIGLAFVTQVEGNGLWIVFGVFFGLNLLSEFVSFTKVIQAVPPLRAFDMLGRKTPKVDLTTQVRNDQNNQGDLGSQSSSDERNLKQGNSDNENLDDGDSDNKNPGDQNSTAGPTSKNRLNKVAQVRASWEKMGDDDRL